MLLSFLGWAAILTSKHDARWDAVEAERVDPVAGLLSPRDVDLYVNNRITYQADARDHWQSPAETFKRGRGDCEDFALAKRALLIAAGRDPADIDFLIVRDRTRWQYHAIIVVDGLVLDSANSLTMPIGRIDYYDPIIGFYSSGLVAFGRKL